MYVTCKNCGKKLMRGDVQIEVIALMIGGILFLILQPILGVLISLLLGYALFLVIDLITIHLVVYEKR